MGSEKLLFRLEQPHGTGDVYTAWQTGSGMYLATTGVDSMVNIFDRYGQIQDRIRLPSLCTGFGWDSDGDLLAIICQSPQLILWDANTQKKIQIDVRLKDQMSCLIWAKTSPMLAVGTVKGNVSIYNHNTSKLLLNLIQIA
jgi:WD repeat-containing protein 19